MIWETYLAFGDSITIGARTYLGYPEVAASLLQKATKREWNAVNVAVSGFTCMNLVRYIDQQSGLAHHKTGVVTVLIGTNDAKVHTTVHDFNIAYRLLLTKLKLIVPQATIKLIAIPSFFPGVMYPYDVSMNAVIAQYNKVILDLAGQFNVAFVDLAFGESHFIDGVHLNDAGVHHAATQIMQMVLKDRGL